jgi:hypothetical protein
MLMPRYFECIIFGLREAAMGPAITFAGTTKDMNQIMTMAKSAEGVEQVSEPSSLDASRALNAAITFEEVESALQIITLIFKSGAALLDFIKALRDTRRAGGGGIGVSDATSGKVLGQIKESTTDRTLTRLVAL